MPRHGCVVQCNSFKHKIQTITTHTSEGPHSYLSLDLFKSMTAFKVLDAIVDLNATTLLGQNIVPVLLVNDAKSRDMGEKMVVTPHEVLSETEVEFGSPPADFL